MLCLDAISMQYTRTQSSPDTSLAREGPVSGEQVGGPARSTVEVSAPAAPRCPCL